MNVIRYENNPLDKSTAELHAHTHNWSKTRLIGCAIRAIEKGKKGKKRSEGFRLGPAAQNGKGKRIKRKGQVKKKCTRAEVENRNLKERKRQKSIRTNCKQKTGKTNSE